LKKNYVINLMKNQLNFLLKVKLRLNFSFRNFPGILVDDMPYERRQDILEKHIEDLQNLQVSFFIEIYIYYLSFLFIERTFISY